MGSRGQCHPAGGVPRRYRMVLAAGLNQAAGAHADYQSEGDAYEEAAVKARPPAIHECPRVSNSRRRVITRSCNSGETAASCALLMSLHVITRSLAASTMRASMEFFTVPPPLRLPATAHASRSAAGWSQTGSWPPLHCTPVPAQHPSGCAASPAAARPLR